MQHCNDRQTVLCLIYSVGDSDSDADVDKTQTCRPVSIIGITLAPSLGCVAGAIQGIREYRPIAMSDWFYISRFVVSIVFCSHSSKRGIDKPEATKCDAQNRLKSVLFSK